MTQKEAKAEALRRWRYGSVKRATYSTRYGYQVGEVRGWGWTRVFEPEGAGTSWEAAFAMADERAAKGLTGALLI